MYYAHNYALLSIDWYELFEELYMLHMCVVHLKPTCIRRESLETGPLLQAPNQSVLANSPTKRRVPYYPSFRFTSLYSASVKNV